jgi:hypothetical protein
MNSSLCYLKYPGFDKPALVSCPRFEKRIGGSAFAKPWRVKKQSYFPIRPYADTPIRRYADPPTRRYASQIGARTLPPRKKTRKEPQIRA